MSVHRCFSNYVSKWVKMFLHIIDDIWHTLESNRQFNIDLQMIVFKTVVTTDVYEPSTRKKLWYLVKIRPACSTYCSSGRVFIDIRMFDWKKSWQWALVASTGQVHVWQRSFHCYFCSTIWLNFFYDNQDVWYDSMLHNEAWFDW